MIFIYDIIFFGKFNEETKFEYEDNVEENASVNNSYGNALGYIVGNSKRYNR